MSKKTIIAANEYTPLPKNPHLFGWTVKPKKEPMRVKTQVRRNQRSVWAREGFNVEPIYSGDLLAQMFEQTDRDLGRQRFPDQEDFKQVERRMGKRMLHTEFVRKVLTLNKSLLYEDSKWNKGHGAFYLVRNEPSGQKKIYTNACFKKGWMPEWTTMQTDTADLPTREGLTLGWRTVLQRLLQRGAITYRQVVAVFGDVTRNDLCGKNWTLAVGHFRN